MRNLLIMRQLLFLVAVMGALAIGRAEEPTALKTNSMAIGLPGTLEIVTPAGWTVTQTNLNLADKPMTYELWDEHKTVGIRFYIRWDGFGGKAIKPNAKEMARIVDNVVTAQWMPIAVEPTFKLEPLKGPAVTGVYARITDRTWSPVVLNTFPNVTEGMFRCGSIWGNFNVLSTGKDGPGFKSALKVLESLRRTKP